jgi:hypothetical protein
MEAEIMAANQGAKEIAWMEKLQRDLGSGAPTTPYVPTLYCDNQSAVDWSHNAKFHDRSKHIEIQYYYVRNDMVNRNRLKIVHIPGSLQPADILTKQLGRELFEGHCKALGMR